MIMSCLLLMLGDLCSYFQPNHCRCCCDTVSSIQAGSGKDLVVSNSAAFQISCHKIDRQWTVDAFQLSDESFCFAS
jgi:hypothetical protein